MGSNSRRRRSLISELLVIALLVCGIALGARAWLVSRANRNTVRAVFETNGSRTPEFILEIAATPAARHLGLMYRRELPPERGMIFLFPNDGDHTFWMKNTYISLDMVFVDAEGKVVGVLADVPTHSETRRSVEKNSRNVIELNAGTAARVGIQEGSFVRLTGALPLVE